jgi:hypothetical protein
MAELSFNSTQVSALSELLSADIEPGTSLNYQTCKNIFLYHPLGLRLASGPISEAMSKPRRLFLGTGGPIEDRLEKAFVKTWERLRLDEAIHSAGTQTRVYGAAGIIVGIPDVASNAPLSQSMMGSEGLYINVVDPLNVSGSLLLNQDPNSPFYQKPDGVAVQGKVYHATRTCVLFNEDPVYLAYNPAAFGYSGRSVFQRPLYPLKSYLQTMIANDVVAVKSGVIVAKVKQAVSAAVAAAAAALGLKRADVKLAASGNVLSIGHDDSIESLNLQNLDGPLTVSRRNILEDIAATDDMPAVMLTSDTLSSSMSEGTEDADRILRYVGRIRKWLTPLYSFLDPICMRQAWTPELFAQLKSEFPNTIGGLSYEAFLQHWENRFSWEWQPLREEPESKRQESDKTTAQAIRDFLQVVLPYVDPKTRAALIVNATRNLNDLKHVYKHEIVIDQLDIEDYDISANIDGSGSGHNPERLPELSANRNLAD